MQREVQTQSVETATESVDICDKCGLEADEMVPLFTEYQTRVHHNVSDASMEFAAELVRERNPKGHLIRAFTVELDPNQALIEELRDDEPDLEICRDCYDEMVGWSK